MNLTNDIGLRKHNIDEVIELLNLYLNNSTFKKNEKNIIESKIKYLSEKLVELKNKMISCYYLIVPKEEKNFEIIINKLNKYNNILLKYELEDAVALMITERCVMTERIADDHFMSYLYFPEENDFTHSHLHVSVYPDEFVSFLELEKEFLKRCKEYKVANLEC